MALFTNKIVLRPTSYVLRPTSYVLALLLLLLNGMVLAQSPQSPTNNYTFSGSPNSNVLLNIIPIPNACSYQWSPTLGIVGPSNVLTPTVYYLGPATYSVTATNFDGVVVGTATVTLVTCGLDAKLFKPTVVAANTMIPDAEEETVGGQTWVNLDNDDNDGSYDDTDVDVAIGTTNDDELMKLEIWNSANRAVSITAPQGAANVKIWTSSRKSSTTAYIWGAPINLTASGTLFTTTLWVEGIAPHTAQRGTQLSVTDGNCADKVAITVLGVESMEWVGRGNGYSPPPAASHTSSVLDNCPNFARWAQNPPATLTAQRVFPDARSANINLTLDMVDLRVRLSTTPIEPINLYLRSFDVDDPYDDLRHDPFRNPALHGITNPTAVAQMQAAAPNLPYFVDPNDQTTTAAIGSYEGVTNFSFSREQDNRGSINGWKEGILSGQNLIGLATLSMTGQIATIGFQVSQQAGDNYRVAANGDIDLMQGGRFRNTDATDKFDIINVNTNAALPAKYNSPILTVWRVLNVESDRMDNYVWGGNVQQIQTEITGINLLNTSSTTVTDNFNFSSAINLVNIGIGGVMQPDPHHHSDASVRGNGRFENGTISVAGAVVCGIASNGQQRVQLSAPSNIGGLVYQLFRQGLTIPDGTATVSSKAYNSSTTLYTYQLTNINTGAFPLSAFINGHILSPNGSRVSIFGSPSATSITSGGVLSAPWNVGGFPCQLFRQGNVTPTGNATVSSISFNSATGIYTYNLTAINTGTSLVSDFINGRISCANGTQVTISGSPNATSITSTSIRIPVILRDDDRTPANNQYPINHPDLSILIAAFSDAYVLPTVVTGQVIPFVESLGPANINWWESNQSIDAFEGDSYWGIHITSAHEGHILSNGDIKSGDSDPNKFEDKIYGIAYRTGLSIIDVLPYQIARGLNVSASFSETHKENEPIPVYHGPTFRYNTFEKSTIAHEAGHQFGLSHGDSFCPTGNPNCSGNDTLLEFPHIGLMSSGDSEGESYVNPDAFIPRYLNLIRSRITSPGR